MASRKRSKTTEAEASSSSGVQVKWQQHCNLPDIEDKLFRQNWDWSRYNDETFGAQWDQHQSKPLYRFNNKQTEVKLWQHKMSKVSSIDKVCVCERVVNEEEFRQIGITQKFERLGWERALDWCEGATPRVYLKAVTNWYSSLRLENEDDHPSQWRLVGDTGKGSMTMSFETMNRIADFDSLGADNYFYYSTNTFWHSELVQADPVGLMEVTLPNYDKGRYDRNHLSCEGKILQNISLENVMVRLGDRGKLRMWDLRVLHALLVGTPKLSWRHITMMNIWDTRNQYKRRMIPYVRLISAMIFQQNRLKDNSLWVLKGIDTIDFAQLRSGANIYAEVINKKAKVVDRKTGFRFEYVQRNEDEEMGEGDGGDEEEEAGDEEDRGRRPPRQRYARRHNESSHTVAQFINNRRRAAYASYPLGTQDTYDNVSAVMGENREFHEERHQWEENFFNLQQNQWDAEAAYRERAEKYWEEQQQFQAQQRAQWEQEQLERAQELSRRQAWEEEQERLRVAREALEDRRWSTMAIGQQMQINNTQHLHDQERHHRDYMAGLPYQEHTPWTNYADLPVPRGPSDPTPHWPEGVGSSYVPPHPQPSVEGERGPLDDYREMMETLTGYSYNPYPPVSPNERYQR